MRENEDKKKVSERENKTENKNSRKDWRRKHFLIIECFDVVLFMKQKQRNKATERKRQKQGNKRKQTRKKRRKEERKEQERDRERESEKGGGKKAEEKQRETLKIKQKCPFLGGKQVFYSIRSKQRKPIIRRATTSKWGGPLGPGEPDP